MKALYIEPGAPWENAYSKIFISHSGEELLEREVFANLKEAKASTKVATACTSPLVTVAAHEPPHRRPRKSLLGGGEGRPPFLGVRS